jgi:hypothetical protein
VNGQVESWTFLILHGDVTVMDRTWTLRTSRKLGESHEHFPVCTLYGLSSHFAQQAVKGVPHKAVKHRKLDDSIKLPDSPSVTKLIQDEMDSGQLCHSVSASLFSASAGGVLTTRGLDIAACDVK